MSMDYSIITTRQPGSKTSCIPKELPTNKPHHAIQTVYLSGTIGSTKAEKEPLERFDFLQKELENLGLKVFNPLRGKKIGDPLYYHNSVVHRDEHDIDRSDLLIAFFPFNTISIGTPMEIYRAREICAIPVIVVSPIQAIREHHWIKAKASFIASSQTEALAYLVEWYLS